MWLLSAEQDSVVAQGVVAAAATYYASFVADPAAQVATVFSQPGEHSFLTLDQGSKDCLYLVSGPG